MTPKITHVVLGHSAPIARLPHNNENLLVFHDVFFWNSVVDVRDYDVASRYDFWKQVYGDRKNSPPLADFVEEKNRYAAIKDALFAGDKLVIWYSRNPDQLLFLWAVADLLQPHFTEKHDVMFSFYDPCEHSCTQTKQATKEAMRTFADLWHEYADTQFRDVNPLCIRFPEQRENISFMHDCKRLFWPVVEQGRFFPTPIDQEILRMIPDDIPAKNADVVGQLLDFLDFTVGEILLFYRLSFLANEIGAIKAVEHNGSNRISYLRTELGRQFLENGIADTELRQKYESFCQSRRRQPTSPVKELCY